MTRINQIGTNQVFRAAGSTQLQTVPTQTKISFGNQNDSFENQNHGMSTTGKVLLSSALLAGLTVLGLALKRRISANKLVNELKIEKIDDFSWNKLKRLWKNSGLNMDESKGMLLNMSSKVNEDCKIKIMQEVLKNKGCKENYVFAVIDKNNPGKITKIFSSDKASIVEETIKRAKNGEKAAIEKLRKFEEDGVWVIGRLLVNKGG